jgi:sugar phosphate isomerase/epimerase
MTAGPLSVLLTSLPLDFAPALAEVVRLGFTHVDLVAVVERPAAELDALADSGLLVCCTSLGRHQPPGCTLDATDRDMRREAVRLVRQQLDDTARLGATCAYLVPPAGGAGAGLPAFAEACALLAEHAAGRMVRLCVEAVPGRLLPDAGGTLRFLDQVAHPNLGLLLDVGHCLISGEDPAAVVRGAGSRVGHVHLDDNDGQGDLHWPLLTGRLTAGHLEELGVALRAGGYWGGLTLELNPANADPVEALRAGREIAEQYLLSGRTHGDKN